MSQSQVLPSSTALGKHLLNLECRVLYLQVEHSRCPHYLSRAALSHCAGFDGY